MAATPPVCDFGAPAPDFELVATDGRRYRRDALRGPNGLLVMFICNHCPFVKAVLDKIVRDAGELKAHGIGSSRSAATIRPTTPTIRSTT